MTFFVVGTATGTEPLDGGFEVDVNFELRLDIHEFRRPGELAWLALVSLGLFGAGCGGGNILSELARVSMWGRWR